jgi:hypothetical protein
MYQLHKKGYEEIAKAASKNVSISVNGANVKEVKLEGPKGDPGTPGKDGKSPVKFVDYFTQDEVNEIVENILSQIPKPKDGNNADPVDYARVLEYVKREVSKIQIPKAQDGQDAVVDYDFIVKTVQKLIKVPKDADPVNYEQIKKFIENAVEKTRFSSGTRQLNSGGPTTRFGDLVDVNVDSATSGQILSYNGMEWVASSGYIPYTGATSDVNLGDHSLTVDNYIKLGNHTGLEYANIYATNNGITIDNNPNTNTNGRTIFNCGATELARVNNGGNWGFLTSSPTHTNTHASTSTGIALYNTADQLTNYERVTLNKSANVFTMYTENGGSGTQRNMRWGDSSEYLEVVPSASSGSAKFNLSRTTASSASVINISHAGMNLASGSQYVQQISGTVSQSGTAGYNALLVNMTESSTGSGSKNLLNLQVGGVVKTRVNNEGVIFPGSYPTASAPTYVIGGMYFDTTLNKLRIGGATGWETVTSA